MPYYVARVVDVPIVNEEKRYGSKWDAWNDIISPESGIEFAWKGVTFYIEGRLTNNCLLHIMTYFFFCRGFINS